MNPEDIENLIQSDMPAATVQVRSPDNTHFEAVVVAAEFEGQGRIARHQRIYACLGSRMGNEIHALSIRAFTPAEWAAERQA